MNQIFVTIVLYKKKWEELPSADLLEGALKKAPHQLLIYDNSPEKQVASFFDESNVQYIHDAENPGLAKAYNKGLELSGTSDLLLLLDQDTELVESYWQTLLTFVVDDTLGAIVPTIFANNQQISPVLADNYINRKQQYPENGRTSKRIMAINSGTALNSKVMKKIGGFSTRFPLDFLDHWLFFALHQQGFEVFISPFKLQHDLSVFHYEDMSVSRYQSILASEQRFYLEFDTVHQAQHQKQLWLRMIKQFLTVKNRQIWKMTQQAYLTFRGVKK